MHKDLKQNFGFEDYRLRRMKSVSAYTLLCTVVYGVVSVIRADIILTYAKNVPKRIYLRIKRFFTMGRLCKLIRKKKDVKVELSDCNVTVVPKT